MKPIIFPPEETEFTSNGLGRLDAISCIVTEGKRQIVGALSSAARKP